MNRFAYLLGLLVCSVPSLALAEPYIAVRAGLACGQCHVNPDGGGMRTAFGNAYARSTLAADGSVGNPLLFTDFSERPIAIGGNLRSRFEQTQIDSMDDVSSFDVDELRLYLRAELVPNRAFLYADQKVAPGGSRNQEAYLGLRLGSANTLLKAGKIYLPFGLRLEDDTAYIREVTGINFNAPDDGLALSLDTPSWTLQAAITNGSAGASDSETGKQYSLRSAWVRPNWRLGISGNHNDTDLGARSMVGVFAGLRTGPIAWLAEVDRIRDDSLGPDGRDLEVALLEANLGWARGHNLKLSAEYFDPDRDVHEDEQNRFSLVSEYMPYAFMQLRGGVRVYDGIPQSPQQNRKIGFIELHAFF